MALLQTVSQAVYPGVSILKMFPHKNWKLKKNLRSVWLVQISSLEPLATGKCSSIETEPFHRTKLILIFREGLNELFQLPVDNDKMYYFNFITSNNFILSSLFFLNICIVLYCFNIIVMKCFDISELNIFGIFIPWEIFPLTFVSIQIEDKY